MAVWGIWHWLAAATFCASYLSNSGWNITGTVIRVANLAAVRPFFTKFLMATRSCMSEAKMPNDKSLWRNLTCSMSLITLVWAPSLSPCGPGWSLEFHLAKAGKLSLVNFWKWFVHILILIGQLCEMHHTYLPLQAWWSWYFCAFSWRYGGQFNLVCVVWKITTLTLSQLI